MADLSQLADIIKLKLADIELATFPHTKITNYCEDIVILLYSRVMFIYSACVSELSVFFCEKAVWSKTENRELQKSTCRYLDMQTVAIVVNCSLNLSFRRCAVGWQPVR